MRVRKLTVPDQVVRTLQAARSAMLVPYLDTEFRLALVAAIHRALRLLNQARAQ
jgi:hypothetical protein